MLDRTNDSPARDAGQRVSISYRPIDELALDPKNPRLHTARQINQIARSIKSFGFNVPVLVDDNLKVVAGHGRVLACQKLGLAEVPTIRLAHLSEAQAKAFMIADNRLNETSAWDDKLLAEHLNELSVLNLDFSLEDTGFEIAEIDLHIEGLNEAPVEADDPADTLPESSVNRPVSQRGDLWLLGPHRILCGSALEPDAYEVLMQAQRAATVFTDPPYNVPIDGHASGLGSVRHGDFAMASGEMSPAEFTAFLTRACTLLGSNSEDGAIHFVCMDWRHIGELHAAGAKAYTELKNICVWVKHNAGMGSLYRSQHEFVFVFKSGIGSHRNNVQLGRFGRNRTNVWNYRGISSVVQATDEGHLLALHPTVKPVALVADALLDCSKRGDIVLDAFLGSGSTVIAAERVGRRCYGLELEPRYVDTVIRRWQAFSGENAKHAAANKTFNEIESEMGSINVH